MDFSIFKAIRSVRSVRLFPVFDSTFDLIPVRLYKMLTLGIDKVSIATRLISLHTVRGTLVCFIRGVKVLWTHVTLLGLARTSNS